MVKLLGSEDIIHKFQGFFEEHYKSELETISLEYPVNRSIFVDYWKIDEYDTELTNLLLNQPYKAIFNAEQAIQQIDTTNGKLKLHFKINNLPDISYKKLKEIGSLDAGKLICIEGLVKKRTKQKAGMFISAFQCNKCGAIIKNEQNEEIIKEPTECYEEQDGCGRIVTFKLITSLSDFTDTQKIQIQENFDNLRAGEQPAEITVYLEDDLVNKVNPGDHVKINGILHTMPNKRGNQTFRNFDFVITCNNIEIQDSIFKETKITNEDIKQIKSAAVDPLHFYKLQGSIAPGIIGYDIEKEAIALQLFGGEQKKLRDGTTIRGDIHILLIGDPGIGKSQLLSYVSKNSPRSVFCTGKGSTGVGLTAAAVRDQEFGEGHWVLEAGALPMADMGIACIDEFDKMNDNDKGHLHPAMEQQEIHISKAGINATLKTRCSILAAANPKEGTFDTYAPIHEQINLQTTLISRFDLIFALRDIINTNIDDEKADRVLLIHKNPNDEQIKPSYDIDFLKKFIAYSKQNIKPVLTEESCEILKKFYLDIRKKSDKNTTITLRQLEAMIRLAESSARSRLSNNVERKDAKRAINIMDHYLNTLCFDNETGTIDILRITSGFTYSQQERMTKIYKIINAGITREEDIITEAEIIGIPKEKTKSSLNHMEMEKRIFRDNTGGYKANV